MIDYGNALLSILANYYIVEENVTINTRGRIISF